MTIRQCITLVCCKYTTTVSMILFFYKNVKSQGALENTRTLFDDMVLSDIGIQGSHYFELTKSYHFL